MEGNGQCNGRHSDTPNGVTPQHLAALTTHKPYDLSGVVTYDLVSRPSKVFHDELGQPTRGDATLEDWLGSLPRQLAANDLRRVADHLARAYKDGRTVGAALGGHVIKTGCAPYLIDWIQRGLLRAIALNGADPMRHHAGARCFAGNFLFSTGPNSQGGGKRTTKGHYDVPMRDCTVTLDNDLIIERGRFADEKMVVPRVAR